MSVHTVTINGIDLVYEKEGSGPPLVFIHGGNASAVQWELIVPDAGIRPATYSSDAQPTGESSVSESAEESACK